MHIKGEKGIYTKLPPMVTLRGKSEWLTHPYNAQGTLRPPGPAGAPSQVPMGSSALLSSCPRDSGRNQVREGQPLQKFLTLFLILGDKGQTPPSQGSSGLRLRCKRHQAQDLRHQWGLPTSACSCPLKTFETEVDEKLKWNPVPTLGLHCFYPVFGTEF